MLDFSRLRSSTKFNKFAHKKRIPAGILKLDGRFHARLFTHLVLKNRKSVVTITQSLNALLFWFPIMFKTNLFLGFKFINTFVFALQIFNCYPFFHFTVDWVENFSLVTLWKRKFLELNFFEISFHRYRKTLFCQLACTVLHSFNR